MRYSVQSRDGIFVKVYGFLSFAKNIGKNIGKNMSKSFVGTYIHIFYFFYIYKIFIYKVTTVLRLNLSKNNK